MRWWPFGRKDEEESMFGSTSSAQVAPAAPPTPGADEDEHADEPRGEAAQRDLDAGRLEQLRTDLPVEVDDLLRSLGIQLPAGGHGQVHVSTQTTELTGANALQFLGQLGTFFAQGMQGTGVATAGGASPLQLHPAIQIVADGVAQANPEHLRAKGVPAQARIVDFEAKPMHFGDSHVAKLTLEVTRPGEQPYTVVTGALVPTRVTEDWAEGRTFPAKVDPDDRNQVLVEWGTA